jgi:hypothetical protein
LALAPAFQLGTVAHEHQARRGRKDGAMELKIVVL